MAQKKKKDKHRKRLYEHTKRAGVPRRSAGQIIFIIFSFIMLLAMVLPMLAPLLGS